MIQYDVAFIGSGHANWHAAVALKQAGKSVVIIEKDLLGGTCTNYGCDAKILLDGPAELISRLAHYQNAGVTSQTTVDWPTFMAYKHQVIDALPNQMAQAFDQLGIDVIQGSGILMGDHLIQVGKQVVSATNIVIGTGQRSKRLAIVGKEFMHDSRDFLNLPDLPSHVTFIGAGIITLEFASLVMALGSQVTIIEHGDRAARGFDARHVEKLVAEMTANGATFHFGETALAVDVTTDGYQVTTTSGLSVATQYVVDATGREPNVTNLGLENAGIHTNQFGIEVDDHLRANGDNIYASGDVVAKLQPKLTPTATFESNYIASQILGDTAPIDYPAIPSVLFALPRLAQVGVTTATAAADPDQYHTQTIPFGQLFAFEYQNDTTAEVTAILNTTNQLVGAAVYGMDAPDLINVLTLIIDQKLTGASLQHMILAFPTATQGIIDALLPLLQAAPTPTK
ncbi:dihydrolipoyl dehydrogenase family protein [Levilactobacillus yiduensis]|uniref:dihydrolipoyl dehydrogenase family protein n=1 Tax=Levilactobacillus yiduensis TaxID=2953880 RepID=UPI000EF2CAD1|nr:NAD(P)/FAD-dependent oxidoreductase [Levilactobacillus yiduensis]AYM02685.1 NAD(P)/FAD-dependent oxidoreductase [Levilactobacillus brevis]